MQSKHNRFLILGSNGYVGGALSKALTIAGYDVWQLSGSALRQRDAPPDCLDSPSLLVVNCAFWDGSKDKFFDFIDYKNMLDFYRESFPESLHIFMSSSQVYRDNRNASEESALDESRFYSTNKLATEIIYRSSFEKFVIFRLGQVLDEKPKAETFFDYIFSNLDNHNPLFYIENCSSRISVTLISTIVKSLLLLTDDHLNQTYNLSSGINLTTADLFLQVTAAASIRKKIKCRDRVATGTWLDITKAQNCGLVSPTCDLDLKTYIQNLRGLVG